MLTACGGSAPTASPSPTASARASTNPSGSGLAGAGVASGARLASLSEYSFTMTVGSGTAQLTIQGQIHSPTNYLITVGGANTYFVNGQAYSVLGSLVQKITLNPGYFQSMGEVAAAKTFAGLTKVAGMKVVASGSCTLAGIPGTTYEEETPANGGLLAIAQEGCVANQGGALLSLAVGVSGSAVPGGITGAVSNFTVTGVGDVAAFGAP